MMVGVRGFEPPTPASRTQYSTRLSYTPSCDPAFSIPFKRTDSQLMLSSVHQRVGSNCTEEEVFEQIQNGIGLNSFAQRRKCSVAAGIPYNRSQATAKSFWMQCRIRFVHAVARNPARQFAE